MPSDDPKFERALAQHLRGGSAHANCPDAETLAAYHERNLSLEEMAKWKEHISACEACQEALALVEATEHQLAEDWENREIPVPEEASIQGVHAGNIPTRSVKQAESAAPPALATPAEIWRRRRPALLRWAIPLGAVAAGVLVFIGIYEQRAKVAHYSDTIVARRQEPPAASPVLSDQDAKVQSPQKSKDVQQTSTEMPRQKREQELTVVPSAKPSERTIATGDAARESLDQIAGGRLEKKKSMPASPAPAITTRAATDAAASENAPAVASAPAPPPRPAPVALGGSAGGVAAERPPARADAKGVPSPATQSATVESQAAPLNGRNSSMMMKQGVANEVVDLTGAATDLILTPDNRVFWKLQPAGTVQLTTDGGKDWKSLETGANEDLTTGFAPSSNVCWIAGRSGTLLLTKDRGTHWSKISTPIAGDLGGVRAVDAKHAYIWDATRHTSYETSDGGSTWKQTHNQ
jgi:hypothetical protein